MKSCRTCKESKPLTEFYNHPTTRDGKATNCKGCALTHGRAYEKTEKAAEARRRYRLKSRFNLTPEEYDIILAGQKGVCAICFKPPGERRLAVDHDHKTGQVRGLLCWGCNAALGKFRDDIERLQRAADYVQHPPVTEHLGREVYGVTGRVTKKKRRARKARRRNT